MKRLYALALTLLLALSLTACGPEDNNGTTGNTMDDTLQDGVNDTQNAIDDAMDDTKDAMDDAANDAKNAFDDVADDLGGNSWDQMVENGKVHDTDGDLTDGENSRS